jgi:hypothetical protein
MSKRGKILLREILETTEAVEDCERALSAEKTLAAARLIEHMREVLRKRLVRIQSRYFDHLKKSARTCGVRLL